MIEAITNIAWLIVSMGWLAVTFFALAAVIRLFMVLNDWLDDMGFGDEIEGEKRVKRNLH